MVVQKRPSIWISTLLLLLIWGWIIMQWPQDSLWYDETVNAYLATSSWETIGEWSTEIDNQVPLHFAALKLWGQVMGTGVFTLRSFSGLSMLLAAAGMMALGKRLGGKVVVGWLGGTIFALSGAFVYAAGEVRVYGLALALSLWSSVFVWELWWQRGKVRWWLLAGYLLVTIPLLYTHYTAWLVIAVQSVFMLVRIIQQKGHGLFYLMVIGASLGLSFVPWLVVALEGRDFNAGTAFEGEVAVDQALETYIGFYAFGQKALTNTSRDQANGYFVLALVLGMVWISEVARKNRRTSKLHLASMILAWGLVFIPLAVMVYAVNQVEAKLAGRHAWVMWPGVALLTAGGLNTIRRVMPNQVIGWAAIAGFLLVPAWLWNEGDTLLDRYPGNFREAFRIIKHEAGPDDILILRDGTLFTAAEYYGSPIPYEGIPSDKLTDVNHQVELYEALNALAHHFSSETDHIWVLSWQGDTMDPTGLAFALPEYYSNGQRTQWLIPGEDGPQNDVWLVQYEVAESKVPLLQHIADFPGVIQVPPDGPSLLGVDVFWNVDGERCEAIVHSWWWRGPTVYPNTLMSLRLVNEEGARVAQTDMPPAGYRFGQEKWTPFVHTLGRAVLATSCDVIGRNETVQVEMVVYDLNREKPTQVVNLANLGVQSVFQLE